MKIWFQSCVSRTSAGWWFRISGDPHRHWSWWRWSLKNHIFILFYKRLKCVWRWKACFWLHVWKVQFEWKYPGLRGCVHIFFYTKHWLISITFQYFGRRYAYITYLSSVWLIFSVMSQISAVDPISLENCDIIEMKYWKAVGWIFKALFVCIKVRRNPIHRIFWK